MLFWKALTGVWMTMTCCKSFYRCLDDLQAHSPSHVCRNIKPNHGHAMGKPPSL